MLTAFDLLMLFVLPFLWYYGIGEGKHSPSFLMKSELTLGLKGFGGDGGVKIGAAPDALSGFGVSNAVASTR